MKLIKHILITISVSTLLLGCASVKPYEKTFINDEEMGLNPRKEEIFEINSETYREGASGGMGSKAGGGCGCY